jgi:hypothetical protein
VDRIFPAGYVPRLQCDGQVVRLSNDRVGRTVPSPAILGRIGREPRYRPVRGHVDRRVVGAALATGLPRRSELTITADLRRVQQRPRPAVEGRAAEARRSNRAADRRLPLPARDQQMEQTEHRLFSFISHNWRGNR